MYWLTTDARHILQRGLTYRTTNTPSSLWSFGSVYVYKHVRVEGVIREN